MVIKVWIDIHGTVVMSVSHINTPVVVVPAIVIRLPSWVPIIRVIHGIIAIVVCRRRRRILIIRRIIIVVIVR